MADAIVHWHQFRVGGGHWTVEVLNPQLRDGQHLYIHPPKPTPTDAKRDYILALVRVLGKRVESGEFDDRLADHIERLLGVPTRDPAGEAEYASWTLGVSELSQDTSPHPSPMTGKEE